MAFTAACDVAEQACEHGSVDGVVLGRLGVETHAGVGHEALELLVNVHPNRKGAWLLDTLYRAWQRAEVDMVRSPGGSPAWALVEVARGHFTYVNLWSKRPAQAYDLAAGAIIVRRAGGELIGLEGGPWTR